MSTSGAAIVIVLQPVPFPKCVSCNYTVVQTTHAHAHWCRHLHQIIILVRTHCFPYIVSPCPQRHIDGQTPCHLNFPCTKESFRMPAFLLHRQRLWWQESIVYTHRLNCDHSFRWLLAIVNDWINEWMNEWMNDWMSEWGSYLVSECGATWWDARLLRLRAVSSSFPTAPSDLLWCC